MTLKRMVIRYLEDLALDMEPNDSLSEAVEIVKKNPEVKYSDLYIQMMLK